MKALRALGLCLLVLVVSGCSTTYSTRQQRAVAGVAIAAVIAGAAVHGSRGGKNLVESGTRPEK